MSHGGQGEREGATMSNVEQIESAILALPPEEFRRLTDWLSELEQRRWDEQLERDVAAGRLEDLAAEAVADYRAGRTREI
jgi:hypothetical protein